MNQYAQKRFPYLHLALQRYIIRLHEKSKIKGPVRIQRLGKHCLKSNNLIEILKHTMRGLRSSGSSLDDDDFV